MAPTQIMPVASNSVTFLNNEINSTRIYGRPG